MVLQPNLISQYTLAVYQISGQSDNAFAFYDNFCCLTKKKKNRQGRNSANFRRFISQKHLTWFSWNLECEVMMLTGISTEKNQLVLLKCHAATFTWKSHYCSSCYELTGVACWFLGSHDTLPCVLIYKGLLLTSIQRHLEWGNVTILFCLPPRI